MISGSKKQYSDLIKEHINSLEMSESIDFATFSFQSEIGNNGNFKNYIGYNITVRIAKEVAMIAGLKGGNTSKELRENSKVARKYFISSLNRI